MKTLQDMLDSDFDTVVAWLEDNSDKFYLVPKNFLDDWTKDCLIDDVERIEAGAPSGEVFDDLGIVEELAYAVVGFIKEKE